MWSALLLFSFLPLIVVGFLVMQLAAVTGQLSAGFSAGIVVGAPLLSCLCNSSWWKFREQEKELMKKLTSRSEKTEDFSDKMCTYSSCSNFDWVVCWLHMSPKI